MLTKSRHTFCHTVIPSALPPSKKTAYSFNLHVATSEREASAPITIEPLAKQQSEKGKEEKENPRKIIINKKTARRNSTAWMAARSMWNVNENEQQLLYDTQRRSHTEMAHTLADGNICLITKQLEQFKERKKWTSHGYHIHIQLHHVTRVAHESLLLCSRWTHNAVPRKSHAV